MHSWCPVAIVPLLSLAFSLAPPLPLSCAQRPLPSAARLWVCLCLLIPLQITIGSTRGLCCTPKMASFWRQSSRGVPARHHPLCYTRMTRITTGIGDGVRCCGSVCQFVGRFIRSTCGALCLLMCTG